MTISSPSSTAQNGPQGARNGALGDSQRNGGLADLACRVATALTTGNGLLVAAPAVILFSLQAAGYASRHALKRNEHT